MSEERVSIVPLFNFDGDVESMKLTDGVCLRRTENRELEGLLEKVTRHIIAYAPLLEPKYILEDKTQPHSMKRVDDTILALRLLKAGSVQTAATFHLRNKNRVTLTIYRDLASVIFPKNPLFLKNEDTPDFIRLWHKVQDLGSKQYLEFPLKIFTETYKEEVPEDRVVDYMVAFESLAFRNVGDIGRKGTSLAIAISMFLGNSKKERDMIREDMKKAYDVRNAKVHALLEKLEEFREQNIGELAVRIENCLRLSLRRLVEE